MNYTDIYRTVYTYYSIIAVEKNIKWRGIVAKVVDELTSQVYQSCINNL